MDKDLELRIRRIYASLGSLEEHELQKVPGKVVESEGFWGVFHDFQGNLSEEQILNLAHGTIHNIANLHGHLKKHFAVTGVSASSIKDSFKNSFDLQVIADLSNNDRHGYPPRDRGLSKRSPRLIDVRRVLRLTTKPVAGSGVGITIGRDGSLIKLGDGEAAVVVTGEVIDDSNARLGDLSEFASRAVKAWEKLIGDLGLKKT